LAQYRPGKERLEVILALYIFKKIPGPSWDESFRKDPTPGPSWYESFRKDPTPGSGDTSLVCIHANTRTRLRPALSIFPPIPRPSWYESFKKDAIPRPGWSEIFEMYQIQGLSWYVQNLIPDQHGMFKS
jgi:hypothetical protein